MSLKVAHRVIWPMSATKGFAAAAYSPGNGTFRARAYV